MATPLKYFPHASETHQTAHEELEALLQTLHESGTLRAINGLCGKFSDVTEVIVTRLNEPPGRKLLGNLAVLAEALTETDPVALEHVMCGVASALGALDAVGRGRPPGVFALLKLMRHADTRRGLYGVTRVLQAIGRQLHLAAEESEPVARTPSREELGAPRADHRPLAPAH